MNFTTEQINAINDTEGNKLVIASAGSGKTSVFTNRIAKMIREKGILPNRILAVTFTKKASEEMRERLAKLVGDDVANTVVMGTFHSIAYRLLRYAFPEYKGKEFAKDWWVLKTIGDICKHPSDKNPFGIGLGNGLEVISEVNSYINLMKNNGFRPNMENDYYDIVMNEAYETFEILKNNANYLTMSDLIIDFHDQLKAVPEFSNYVAQFFDRIQIDEFQDTSQLVLNCIKHINNENVFVVGDFRQSIYSFIGAEVNNILHFADQFENTTTYELQTNFRSSFEIVEFSNRIIDKSPIESYKRFKPSEAHKGSSEAVRILDYETEDEESYEIAGQIEQAIKMGIEPSEIAVLVRTNAQIGFYENELNARDIKYDVSRGGSFFQYGEILDIVSYLRIAIDKNDNTSVRRVINRPSRFITNKLISDLDVHAKRSRITLWEALRDIPSAQMGRQAKNIQEFLYTVEELTRHAYSMSPRELVEYVITLTDYKSYIKTTATSLEKFNTKVENLNKLVKIASRYKNVQALLNSIDEMENNSNKKEEKRTGVQLMTIHASKGLEFDIVYVPSVVQGVLPHEMAMTEHNIEEERRLFYVASSRARERLQVSSYNTVVIENEKNGTVSVTPVFISEFLKELMEY